MAVAALGFNANAQSQANQTGAVNQTVDLLLSNVLEMEFVSNGQATGPTLQFEFDSINDYVNGIESDPQQIVIRSNKSYTVEVKANAANFSYVGTTFPAPSMPVAGVLSLIVTENNTGGYIHSPFSASTYYSLRDFNEYIIGAGGAGANQTFSVKYKATPGFSYPAGAYSIDVVYTATQL